MVLGRAAASPTQVPGNSQKPQEEEEVDDQTQRTPRGLRWRVPQPTRRQRADCLVALPFAHVEVLRCAALQRNVITLVQHAEPPIISRTCR
tara:strand:- start:556 stop:828 length:273 start_codon:yes stop_codon:yes gene_type:complete